MIELTRTNDPVFLSRRVMRLEEDAVGAVVPDARTAIAGGSIGAVRRRVMAADDDWARARPALREAAGL